MAAESTGAAPAAVPSCLEGKGPGERAAILHQHLGRREMTDVIIETIQPRPGTGLGGEGGGGNAGFQVCGCHPPRLGGGLFPGFSGSGPAGDNCLSVRRWWRCCWVCRSRVSHAVWKTSREAKERALGSGQESWLLLADNSHSVKG